MKSGTWQTKAVMIAVGAVLVVAAWVYWPKASFWYAKREAVAAFAKISAQDRGVMNCVLAKQVRRIPAASTASAPADDKSIEWADNGYRFALPAREFRHPADANGPGAAGVFEGKALTVRVLGVGPKTASFKDDMAPTNAEAARFFQGDPHEIVVRSLNATPADIDAAKTHAELQTSLYLLLMKSVLQTIGSDRLWEQFDTGRRKGILSGNTTCSAVIADFYCPETREFATITLAPGPGATMDDVYRSLSQLRITRDPTAGKPPLPLGTGTVAAPGLLTPAP